MRESIVVVTLVVALGVALVIGSSVPVVVHDSTGRVCGCVVDGDWPTMQQCEQVDMQGNYEIVHYQSCK